MVVLKSHTHHTSLRGHPRYASTTATSEVGAMTEGRSLHVCVLPPFGRSELWHSALTVDPLSLHLLHRGLPRSQRILRRLQISVSKCFGVGDDVYGVCSVIMVMRNVPAVTTSRDAPVGRSRWHVSGSRIVDQVTSSDRSGKRVQTSYEKTLNVKQVPMV